MTDDLQNPANPQADFWACVQADYASGMTAAMIAERYRISVSTIRRRAADYGWRRSDRPFSWKSPYADREAAVKLFPELLELEEEQAGETIDLLFHPTTQSLRCFAFRRAAEAAARGRPSESAAWMRLVNSMNLSGERIDAEMRPFREAQYIRAEALAGLKLPDMEDAGLDDA